VTSDLVIMYLEMKTLYFAIMLLYHSSCCSLVTLKPKQAAQILGMLSVLTISPALTHAASEVGKIVPDVSGQVDSTRKKVLDVTNNFLANNKALETVRRMEQMDFDDSQTNKEILMVPIVRISRDFEIIEKDLSSLLNVGENDDLGVTNLKHSKDILEKPEYSTKVTKSIFNRYSDNIYLASPDQANVYLAGGTLPSTLQTEQYLLRNKVLTAIQNVQQDLSTMLEEKPAARRGDAWRQVVEDSLSDLAEGKESLTSYLLLADPTDVKLAKHLVYE